MCLILWAKCVQRKWCESRLTSESHKLTYCDRDLGVCWDVGIRWGCALEKLEKDLAKEQVVKSYIPIGKKTPQFDQWYLKSFKLPMSLIFGQSWAYNEWSRKYELWPAFCPNDYDTSVDVKLYVLPVTSWGSFLIINEKRDVEAELKNDIQGMVLLQKAVLQQMLNLGCASFNDRKRCVDHLRRSAVESPRILRSVVLFTKVGV